MPLREWIVGFVALTLVACGAKATPHDPPIVAPGWMYFYDQSDRNGFTLDIPYSATTYVYHNGGYVRTEDHYIHAVRDDGRRSDGEVFHRTGCWYFQVSLSPSGRYAVEPDCTSYTVLESSRGVWRKIGTFHYADGDTVQWLDDDRIVASVRDSKRCPDLNATQLVKIVSRDGRVLSSGDCVRVVVVGPKGIAAEGRTFPTMRSDNWMYRRPGDRRWHPGEPITSDSSNGVWFLDESGLLHNETGATFRTDQIFSADWAR